MNPFVGLAEWLAHVVYLITTRPPLQAGLIGWAVGFLICPFYMYLIAIVSEWRWLRYRDQFKAFMPGNLFLGVVFGTSCYLYADARRAGQLTGFFAGHLWEWVSLSFAALLVVVLSALDIMGAITYRPGDVAKYSWRQLISWTKVWHNVFVYGIYGYLLTRVGVSGLIKAPWNAHGSETVINGATRVMQIASLGVWLYCLARDAKFPKHQTGHVAVNRVQWCIGLVLMGLTVVALAQV